MLKLTDDNYLLLAMRHYDNGVCKTVDEFKEDVNRIKYIKRLLTSDSDNKVRLVLNHTIIMYNVFGQFAGDMLFFKIEQKYWHTLATILIYLNKIDDVLPNGVLVSQVGLDEEAVKELRQI